MRETINAGHDQSYAHGVGIAGDARDAEDAADTAVLRVLDELVKETYQLWDHEWVGFSWRNYTYDHVRRVRNLALSLAREEEEGADTGIGTGTGISTRVLDFAAVLHDVTKSYDGEVILRDGQRVLDDNGFWRNEFLPPARRNAVTQLYEELGLAGTLHNVSGACIADALLARHGFGESFRAHAAEIIVSHLKVTDGSSLEGRCLYDADTIDANIGHPALYRNIQITMHFLDREHEQQGASTSTAADMTAWRDELLRELITEKWPAWVGGKNRDFVARMTTAAGRRRAEARITTLQATVEQLRRELAGLDAAIDGGYLAPILHFIANTRNPSLAAELALLEARWPAGSAGSAGSPHPAARFLERLRRESEGDE